MEIRQFFEHPKINHVPLYLARKVMSKTIILAKEGRTSNGPPNVKFQKIFLEYHPSTHLKYLREKRLVRLTQNNLSASDKTTEGGGTTR